VVGRNLGHRSPIGAYIASGKINHLAKRQAHQYVSRGLCIALPYFWRVDAPKSDRNNRAIGQDAHTVAVRDVDTETVHNRRGARALCRWDHALAPTIDGVQNLGRYGWGHGWLYGVPSTATVL